MADVCKFDYVVRLTLGSKIAELIELRTNGFVTIDLGEILTKENYTAVHERICGAIDNCPTFKPGATTLFQVGSYSHPQPPSTPQLILVKDIGNLPPPVVCPMILLSRREHRRATGGDIHKAVWQPAPFCIPLF
jgi:hypothetical protein